jgi:uncharacterized membrane protein YbhN (UPF0104 family)
MSETSQKRSNTALYLLLFLLVAAALAWALRNHIHFQWRTLPKQFATVAWSHIVLGILIIYICYGLRAVRWSVLLAPMRQATAWELLPAQVIGFTGVAIFGRVADLSRPYMIARRTQTTVTTQIAVYSIERAFDLAAAAILFSVALAFAPANMPHHEAFSKAGILSMAATLVLAAIAATIRFKGEALARITERLLHPIVPKLADAAAARVLDLQSGFGAVSTFSEFFSALGLSLLMWLGIAACYLLTATAFHATPTLANFSFSATMLILATGIGGSVVQLPVLGWFTQIALFATTLHALFGVPVETATACAALIFAVTNLAIIPAGLIMAQVQGIGLRDAVSRNSAG